MNNLLLTLHRLALTVQSSLSFRHFVPPRSMDIVAALPPQYSLFVRQLEPCIMFLERWYLLAQSIHKMLHVLARVIMASLKATYLDRLPEGLW
jgi:hypothetical protein